MSNTTVRRGLLDLDMDADCYPDWYELPPDPSEAEPGSPRSRFSHIEREREPEEPTSVRVPPGRNTVDESSHPESVLLRPEEAADRLRLSRTRVYELMATGELPSVTIHSSRRVPLVDLIAFIESKRV